MTRNPAPYHPDQGAIEFGKALAQSFDAHAARARGAPPAARAKARDLVFAIGDSWFNYWPRGDILDRLEDRQLHIERCAKAGRKLTEMLYAQAPRLSEPGLPDPAAPRGEALAWLIGRLRGMSDEEKARPLSILVSAGGNDVAGEDAVLQDLVLPNSPAGPRLHPDHVDAWVRGHLRAHYAALLACITQVCAELQLAEPPLVLLHGYAYPVPDGRGVLGRSWLAPALQARGYADQGQRIELMRKLIDELNKVQKNVIAQNQPLFAHVRHVDVRVALKNDARYRLDWQNELHPTIPNGFAAVTELFVKALAERHAQGNEAAATPAAPAA